MNTFHTLEILIIRTLEILHIFALKIRERVKFLISTFTYDSAHLGDSYLIQTIF